LNGVKQYSSVEFNGVKGTGSMPWYLDRRNRVDQLVRLSASIMTTRRDMSTSSAGAKRRREKR
jgi:hypothetical protein